MSEKTPKDRDVIMGLIWLASPEGLQAARDLRRGTLRISADPEDPDRAWLTYPDETVVHGRLLENGDFVPDAPGIDSSATEEASGRDKAGSADDEVGP